VYVESAVVLAWHTSGNQVEFQRLVFCVWYHVPASIQELDPSEVNHICQKIVGVELGHVWCNYWRRIIQQRRAIMVAAVPARMVSIKAH
jgi:hypothetical protein